MDNITVIILLLFGVAFLSLVSKRYNFPIPIVLVLCGVVISVVPGLPVIALSPERVKEIIKMNKEGAKPKDLLEFVKIEKIVELGYSNVVGQDSLTRFEKNFKKNPNQNRNKQYRGNQNANKTNNSSKGNNA